MMRKLMLLTFNWTRDKDPRVPLGHASLLAALEQEAAVEVHARVWPVNTGDVSADDVVADCLAQARGLAPSQVDVAIGVYVWGEELVQETLRGLRAGGFEGRIILGGPQISYAPAGIDALYPEADVFVRGYGEEVLCRLAATPGRPVIPGVHYAGEVDRVEQAKVDLNALPSPWLHQPPAALNRGFLRWETQRGCPFKCAFCQHREAGARLHRRELDEDRVLAEVDLFCKAGIRDIAVLDPIFNATPRSLQILERFVAHGFEGRLSLQCRAEYVNEDFLRLASQLDVRLEFGLQTIHDVEGRAIERRNHMGKVEAALEGVRALGIDHEVTLIFGLPMQTLDSFEQSVAWCLERQVPVIKAFPLMLLRGTRLDLERARWGLRESKGAMPMVIGADTFDLEAWCAMARLSEALRRSERAHPASLAGLKRLADALIPELERWTPSPDPIAALVGSP